MMQRIYPWRSNKQISQKEAAKIQMGKEFVPASADDKRRKINNSYYLLLDAQLEAGELTIRQAASTYGIRTKYIAKRRIEQEQRQQQREIDFYGLNKLLKICEKCPACGGLFLPQNLERHINMWNGSCKKWAKNRYEK